MFNITTKFELDNRKDSIDVISITDNDDVSVKVIIASYSKAGPGNAYILADEHLSILEGKVTATSLPILKLELMK